MNLQEIQTIPRTGTEKFCENDKSLNFGLIDFWAWNQSDLIENRNRGILAEFLIRQALGIKTPTRLEWDAYDLITENGTKIEVKSSAYIQAWEQEKYSKISFDIKPTSSLKSDNSYSKSKKRHSDIYIFCLLHHKDQETINPLNLDQWAFYIVTTKELNDKIPNQKTIGISTIEVLNHQKCKFSEIKNCVKRILQESHL